MRLVPEPIKQALRVPVANFVERLLRYSARPMGLVLLYHRIDPSRGDPATEINPALDMALFAAQLDHLVARYRVVPLSTLFEAARRRGRGERVPVAISFDDDLPSHLRFAAPLLRERGATAGFFLCGAALDRPYAFWWDRLQRATNLGIPPDEAFATSRLPRSNPSSIFEAAVQIQSMRPQARDAAAKELGRRVGPDPPDSGLRADDVRKLVAQGFEIGFHTRRHYPLTHLTDPELALAMTEGREALESVIGAPLTMIAYPHGYADERVAVAARASGYHYGYTTNPAPVSRRTDPLLIGRIEPLMDTVGRFALQLIRALLGRPYR